MEMMTFAVLPPVPVITVAGAPSGGTEAQGALPVTADASLFAVLFDQAANLWAIPATTAVKGEVTAGPLPEKPLPQGEQPVEKRGEEAVGWPANMLLAQLLLPVTTVTPQQPTVTVGSQQSPGGEVPREIAVAMATVQPGMDDEQMAIQKKSKELSVALPESSLPLQEKNDRSVPLRKEFTGLEMPALEQPGEGQQRELKVSGGAPAQTAKGAETGRPVELKLSEVSQTSLPDKGTLTAPVTTLPLKGGESPAAAEPLPAVPATAAMAVTVATAGNPLQDQVVEKGGEGRQLRSSRQQPGTVQDEVDAKELQNSSAMTKMVPLEQLSEGESSGEEALPQKQEEALPQQQSNREKHPFVLAGVAEPAEKSAQHIKGISSTTTEKALEPLRDSIMTQVQDAMAANRDRNNREISIQLKPAELGELKITIRLDEQRLKLDVITDNRYVKEIMLSNIDTLKESLSRQNITMSGLDVSVGSGNQYQQAFREGRGQGTPQPYQRPAWLPDAETALTEQLHYGWERREDSLVDLTL